MYASGLYIFIAGDTIYMIDEQEKPIAYMLAGTDVAG